MAATDSDSERLCPHCGWPVDEGAKFCGECARELPANDPAPTAGTPPVPSSIDQGETRCETPADTGEAVPAPVAPLPAEPRPLREQASPPGGEASAQPGPASIRDREQKVIEGIDDRIERALPKSPQSAPAPPPSAVDLGDSRGVLLEVDAGRVLLENADIPLRARVTALTDGVRRVDLRAECSWGEGKPFRFSKRLRGLGRGRSRELSLPCRVPPGVRGIKTVRWEIAYDGSCFEGETEHMVYPADPSASKVAGQINFTVQQGHAGDVHVGNLLGENREMSHRELIERICQAAPDWRGLELWTVESLGPPELPEPPVAARLAKLTLRTGNRRLHLLSGDTVRLGRSRDNDLVVRAFAASGQLQRDLSLRVSGSHLTIRRTGGSVCCEDHSANGSRLDEHPMHQSRGMVETGSAHRLELGALDGPVAATADLRLVRCGLQTPARGICPDGPCERDASSALFFARCDGVPEDSAIVWCHLALRSCRPDLPDLRVWRLAGAFAWRSETGSGWLVPGTKISLPGCSGCSVEPFNQFGL